MDLDQIAQVIKERELSVDDPLFYAHAFTYASQQRKKSYATIGDNFRRVFAEEYNELSNRLDKTKFQESCSVRNVLRTRRLANLLIDDKGEINQAVLPRLISLLTEYLYSLGPGRQFDAKRQMHLLKVLMQLNENKEVIRLLKSIDKPMSHKYADQMIRDTMRVPSSVQITDAHARRAVLSAWMCMLRQNVGSCFATAPGIIIQSEQPEVFLKDIAELLTTGRLKRTFGGVEYSVPLSLSWGAGDLKKPFYLLLGHDFEGTGLWLSPGLTGAFEAAGMIDPEAELAAKDMACKAILMDVINSLEWNQPFILITAEELIRKALLKNLKLTEQDIKDYENRPRGMIQGGILMQPTVLGGGSGGKGALCETFFGQIEAASSAFKGLTDNALLKAWEFTVASFAETKAQFTRWNLYSSLGLGPNEQGGIGAAIFEVIRHKLDQANERVKDFQFEYEQVFNVLKTMEARMRSASTEKEAQWLRAEYQTKRNEFYTLEEMRDEIHGKAERFANLYDGLIEQYDNLFPRYFQEVYDADMHDVHVGPYDDSPAGFRLLYKYGRSNTSQWSLIKTPAEFIDALAGFFMSTENEIASSTHLKGLRQELSEIVTAIVNHVRTKEFLETAFHRMAAAHHTRMVKDPLEHLDQIDKKPWAYTSGGTMATLVSCYYRRESRPTEASRWVESPIELLVYFIDTLKQNPPKLMENYLNDPDKSMLIHSPTHAFLLKPGREPFQQAWQKDAFTYTWVRDNIVIPKERFVDSIWLDEEMMQYLVLHLSQLVPINYRHYFLKTFSNMYGNMKPPEFRDHILDGIQRERGLRQVGASILSSDEIDSTLYSLLPLFPRGTLRERLEELYGAIPSISSEQREQMLQVFDLAFPTFSGQRLVSAETLQNISKGLLCLTFEETTSSMDYHALISQAAQKLGFAMPGPLIFADTNWVKEEFGFVLNPGSGKFELWRIDLTGRTGAPMSNWDQWVNGSRQDITWGIYTKPYEYSL